MIITISSVDHLTFENFFDIQDGIEEAKTRYDASLPNPSNEEIIDTVLVYGGPYKENLKITRPVHLKAVDFNVKGIQSIEFDLSNLKKWVTLEGFDLEKVPLNINGHANIVLKDCWLDKNENYKGYHLLNSQIKTYLKK